MGFSEILLLGAIALIFIGPKQLPEVARVIARFLNELRRVTGDFNTSVFEDIQREAENFKSQRTKTAPTQAVNLPPMPPLNRPPAVTETKSQI